jgi:hypothetical protein
MSTSDRLLVACPQCHAWPMAASGSKYKWSREMMFCCPRCGHHEIFNMIYPKGTPGKKSATSFATEKV